MKIALVTHRGLPDLDPDDRVLPSLFASLGAPAEIAIWDDPEVEWSSFDAVLLRSPWDYFHRRDAFLAWAEAVSAATVLLNPLELVRWNTDKRYLGVLAERGVPVVPTAFVGPGASADLAALLAARGWSEAIVKPAVSADSWETVHVGPGTITVGQALLDRLAPERTMMVQPFVQSVETYGERCLVFLEGELSHAIRKNALTQGGRWAGLPEGRAVAPTADEAALARTIVAGISPTPLYARVDLVRDDADRPLLLELELTEPTLFFADHPQAARRLAEAVLRRAGSR